MSSSFYSVARTRSSARSHLRAAGLSALADLGFLGLTDGSDDPVIVTGFKATRARKLAPGEKQANRVLAAARAPVEHGCAHLKTWRILTRTPHRARSPHRTLRALLVLSNLELSS
ncbi:hypothetical protein OG365_31475 [Streptomyces sp. NBC_00853]|uniref:transposase family protein n=1 Tax=Streptomyces TaxID=1883 RepID=UPI0037916695|nr:hypothetical protein OG365_31475 [Streptomyces sp. NBC_00853]